MVMIILITNFHLKVNVVCYWHFSFALCYCFKWGCDW